MAKSKILIIDDENDFLMITKMNLEDTGKFEVLTLPSAKDVISSLHSFQPDLILLDLLMPGIGGVEVCEILNKDPLGQSVPVIVITALNKSVDKANAYKEGVVDYLVKPIERDELILRIEKAIQLKNRAR